jgi:hypothetical protein
MITWKPGKYGSESGTAGSVSLFGITYRTQREAPAWTMRTSLPGLESRQWQDDDRDVLKARAEDILGRWLARIGAARKTED